MQLKTDSYSLSLHLALAGLTVLVLVLAKENHELKNPYGNQPELEIGQNVEPVELRHLDGVEETLNFADGDQDRLLLVFTTTCPACRDNQVAWRTLHQRVGDAMDVVGISLSGIEETRGYRDTHNLRFPVTVPTDGDRFAEDFAISAIPMTIRIGTDGRVRGSWLGELSEARLAEVWPTDQG